MSFDRVLPKPPALHYDAMSHPLPRRTSNLLEHKIMSDNSSSNNKDNNNNMSPKHAPGDRIEASASCGFAADPRINQVTPLSLSSVNSANVPIHMVSFEPSNQTKSQQITPLLTRDISLRKRSSSASSGELPPPRKESGMQFCLCQPDPKIPRPRNAFILYRQHNQAQVVSQNPGLANPAISKIIGEQWRELPEEMKKEWQALAEEEKARHHQQYPNYRYQPRRFGRDGSARASNADISPNPAGSTVCGRCGGRIMHPPVSPETPRHSLSSPSFQNSVPTVMTTTVRSSQCAEKNVTRAPAPTKTVPLPEPSVPIQQHRWEQAAPRSPDHKRRRFNVPIVTQVKGVRDGTSGSPYPLTPYPHVRGPVHVNHPTMVFRAVKEHHPPQDPCLKLPPLQTTAVHHGVPAPKPVTPFIKDGSSLEATVMTIPAINKIKVLAKISPPLEPSFRDVSPKSQPRGAVIAVDGQDAAHVNAMVYFLAQALSKEGRFAVRVFEGPELRSRQPSPELGQMGDATVDYLNTISAWHRISDDIVQFVKGPPSPAQSHNSEITTAEEDPHSGVSPKSLIPRTAGLRLHSPDAGAGPETRAEARAGAGTSVGDEKMAVDESPTETQIPTPNASCSPAPAATAKMNMNKPIPKITTALPSPTSPAPMMRVVLVPQYQLTTADAFACSIPINDSYAPLDHWQWMAALWRACVGPDVTIHIRDCTKEELDRTGGSPVEVRLHDARAVLVRRALESPRGLEEKVMKRVGFEVEDFLTQ